jgi:RimJ/RimL family protein N-acetyltransferase
MKPIEYLLMQFELEGIQRVSSDLITRASQNVDDFPLVLSARTSDRESLICFDELLSEETCNKLPKDDLQEFKTEAALEVLKNSGIQVKVSHFKTYIFPESFQFASVETVKCFSQDDSRIIAFGFHGLADKVFAIENEGVILSACVSARQNSRAAEAWVFTHSDYRQKGLAQQVVTAWAKNTLQEGLTPFYSHNVENTNSARLAKRLNLIQVFEEIVIEKVP